MHFCFTGQYTPQSLNAILDNPTMNRYEVAKKLIEAAGGKLISMYGVPADGPGVLAIFDVPDPGAAAAGRFRLHERRRRLSADACRALGEQRARDRRLESGARGPSVAGG